MKPCADLCGAGGLARMLILAVGGRQVSRRDAGATGGVGISRAALISLCRKIPS
jgi:hypothetical protein